MESLGITLFVVFFVYLLLGMPLAICLGLSVIATFWYHETLPLMAVAQKLYNGLDQCKLIQTIVQFLDQFALMQTGSAELPINAKLLYSLP